MRIKILVIDDEESICEILKYNLEKEGYEVECAYSAEEALRRDLTAFNLCIVDIMMDELSGYDFVKRVRYNPITETLPVIFCSALNGEDDTVMGLNIGADDFITKPFVISEVIARVRAVLRRSNIHRDMMNAPRVQQPQIQMTAAPASKPVLEPDIVFKTLRIDQNDKTCYIDNIAIDLTRREFDLLLFFLTHRNRIYSRDEIIKMVWAGDVVVTNRTIDTNLSRLRQKLGAYSQNIATRLGFGYGFKETI